MLARFFGLVYRNDPAHNLIPRFGHTGFIVRESSCDPTSTVTGTDASRSAEINFHSRARGRVLIWARLAHSTLVVDFQPSGRRAGCASDTEGAPASGMR